jgi:hypothetical protein
MQAPDESSVKLTRFLEKRLFNEICPVETSAVARRVFKEYGAVFAADTTVQIPNKCIFSDESEVRQFQLRLILKNAVIRGVNIELQKAAMDKLLEAVAEANEKGRKITPLDGSVAARRGYYDTVRLWNSRFIPALNYWVGEGKISPDESVSASNAEIRKQVEMVIEWESKGWYFSTDLSKSIFSSVAPPGTSQHLSLLAFDLVEASNAHVLPAFLTENGGLNSGFMIVQYTAASLCTENKILAHPASVDTIPSSANVEDHVSMGATAALKLRQVAENLEIILSLELFCAAQGIDFRRKQIGMDKTLGKGTRRIYDLIRSKVPFIEKDEYLKDHMDSVRHIVETYRIEPIS